MYQRPSPPAPPVVEHEPIVLIPSRFIRQGDHPELPQPIPGLLEGYVTILAGAGGAGKTFLAEQVARHLASNVQLGSFPLPDEPIATWFLVLEDVEALTQARSLEVAAFGKLAEDQSEDDTGHDTMHYITDGKRGIASLRDRLEAARVAGDRLPGMVIIDYLHLFIGSQPTGVNPVDWERKQITALRDLAIEYGHHVLVLTHMTKEGKVNGTNGLLNATDSMYVLELSSEDRDIAALVCRKMRMAPMTDYAMGRKANGSWGFTTEILVSEALTEGLGRDILRVLREEGPKTLGQIVAHYRIGGERAGIRTALSRGRKRGFFTLYRGHWHATETRGDTLLQPEPPGNCAACGLPMVLRGEKFHPTCDPEDRPPQPAPAAAPEPTSEPEWEEAGNPRDATVLTSLKRSVETSRYHPLPRVPKELRDEAPWNLITEEMGGQPSWTAEGWSYRTVRFEDEQGKPRRRRELVVPQGIGGTTLVLDRNGSYPSACGSVPLAPNKLLHTGPMAYDTRRAGLFLVACPVWEPKEGEPVVPHPLGAMAEGVEPGEPVWVATPHLRLLRRLFKDDVPILDSWTGVANGSLFERFAEDAKRARRRRKEDEAGYTAWKYGMGSALRLLWPKQVSSPFWRPDWRVAVVAEASVRHWVQANKAAQHEGPHRLVALANTDEVAFWTPDGRVPFPYIAGDQYGQVEIKARLEGTQ